MTIGKSMVREPSLGQVISVPANALLADDSMSSLGSSQSSMVDSTEEQSIEIEFDLEEVDRMRRSRGQSSPIKPQKKRTKPRRQRTMDGGVTPVVPTTTTPNRTHSSPDLSPTRPTRAVKSRWEMGRTVSSEASPAHPQRPSRRFGDRTRPTIKVDQGHASFSHISNHNKPLDDTTSLKLNASHSHSHSFHESTGSLSRWCADESLAAQSGNNSLHNSMSGGQNSISGRWQDSFSGTGHESASRWSTSPSLCSSQMELLSTRPRVPRRQRSVFVVPSPKSGNSSMSDVQNNHASMTSTQAGGNDSFTLATEAETDTQATGRATVGSSQVLEEFSMDSSSTQSKGGVVIDCSILTGTTGTAINTSSSPVPPSPAAAKMTKPRPQLPHRQKSFGRNMTMGMAAQAAMATKRADLVRQRSEPSLPKRQPSNSDLTLTSLDDSSRLSLSRSSMTGYGQRRRSKKDEGDTDAVAAAATKKEGGTDAVAATTAKKDEGNDCDGNDNQATKSPAPRRVQRGSYRRSSIDNVPFFRSTTGNTDATSRSSAEQPQQHAVEEKCAPPRTGRFAAVRKQKSLSCLQSYRQFSPQQPQRRESDASSLADILSANSGRRPARRQVSISSLVSSHSTGPRASQ